MRVLICGDRHWRDGKMIEEQLDREQPSTVIEGEAQGADRLAALAADNLGVEILAFPAKWAVHGRAAGPIRNTRMLIEDDPDEVWAFHDDLEQSKGTKNMVKQAKAARIPVKHFHH